MIIKSECEFCGKDKKVVSTPFGIYCLECFKLIRDECNSAIYELEEEEDD